MRDVAAKAEVSFKTVSRVVNAENGVRDEVISRVQDAIDELGYRPDHRARGLRTNGSTVTTIGLVLRDISSPFFGNVFRGIEELAQKRDCLVLAGNTDDSPEREHRLIDSFIGRRVDGLIVVSCGSSGAALKSEMDRGTPVVFVDMEPEFDSIDLVRSDHFAGSRDMTEHLLKIGHTDIVFFGDDPAIFSAGLRVDGFLDALSDRGITPAESRVVTGRHSDEEWHEIILDYLAGPDRPTAIVGAQNFVTAAATRALHTLGLQHTIAQVGFDDLQFAELVEPGLTVISQRPRELGRQAAARLFSRLDDDIIAAEQRIIQAPLIIRGSGEIPPPNL